MFHVHYLRFVPPRFKRTIGHKAARFNYVVAVNIMYINKKQVLNVVHEATHLKVTCWLQKISSEKFGKNYCDAGPKYILNSQIA